MVLLVSSASSVFSLALPHTRSHTQMGCVGSKYIEEKKQLRATIHFLEEEIREMKCKREKENKAHDQYKALVGTKEVEWKHERKKFKDEYEMLRNKLEEEEGRRKVMESVVRSGGDGELDAGSTVNWYIVEQMRMEQARREEAVEKWKQLYLAIKKELDDLIQRTGQGASICCGTEREIIVVLQRELKAREDMLELLRLRLKAMEREGAKREREIDIMKQSLRILSATKCATTNKKKNTGFSSRS